MKAKIKPRSPAITRVEVLLIIAVICVLVAIFLPALAKAKAKSSKIGCINNLKQIGLSFRIWGGDNQDQNPMRISVTNGGTMEWVAGGEASPHFLVMSNELSTPKVLVCPQDQREPATAWTSFSNSNISYFVGLDAAETQPTVLLSGDSNLEIDGRPVRSGLLDLRSNGATGWTAVRHGKAGNVCFADGSVQQFSNAKFREVLANTGVATNRLAMP